MSRRNSRIIVALILAALLASWLGVLRLAHRRLERMLAQLEQGREQVAQRTTDERRLADLAASAAQGNAEARQEIHARLLRTRAELAALERSAAEGAARRQAQAAGLAAALAQNRDPNAGLTRLEYFQDVGRATPADAFQTLVWAVMKGDPSLSGLLTLNQAARQEAKAMLAQLPPESRAEYPTPEKLAALAISDLVLRQTAAAIGGMAVTSPTDAELSVTFSGSDDGVEKIPFQLGPAGWQVKLSAHQIQGLQRQLLQGR